MTITDEKFEVLKAGFEALRINSEKVADEGACTTYPNNTPEVTRAELVDALIDMIATYHGNTTPEQTAEAIKSARALLARIDEEA